MSEPLPDAELYAPRRARVLELLGEDAAMILPAAPELLVGRDLELRYRPDPDLFYLTGCTEPEAVAILCPAHHEAPFTLLVRPRDEEAELWSGARGGPAAARERYSADAVAPIADLAERLQSTLRRVDAVHYRLRGGREEVDALVLNALADSRKGRQRQGRGVRAVLDPGGLLDELRLVKGPEELRRVREACELTVDAFLDAAAVVRPGAGEWQVEAALEAGFRRRGAHGSGFPSIVASGPNATVLHYVTNDRRMSAGELLLVDAGASVAMYNGDISRTFPVGGRFLGAQRSLYQVVRSAHRAALEAVRPGATETDVHRAAVRSLVDGLLAEGLLEGDAGELVEDRDVVRGFFPHRTSHWLGLEVHDVGDYALAGRPRPLEPGMVLTVEPGLYFAPSREDVPVEVRGLGIRLEDDVVVTSDGCENLTARLPIDPGEVEALLASD